MTLKEAGEIYKLQTNKIGNVKNHIVMIGRILDEDKDAPIQESVLRIRREILMTIAEDLIDYLRHLEAVLDEEVEIDHG